MENDLIFRILVLLLLAGFAAHRGYSTRKFARPPADTVVERKADRMQRAAGVLAIPALLATLLYVVAPRWVAWASLPLPAWLRWAGLGVALAGFTLLQWAHVALGRNWSDTPRLLRGQTLVREGPYRRIRHPIYSAFLLILGSTLLLSANWLVGGLWIAAAALDIASRVRFEDAVLEAQFGDVYRAYAKETGALLPRLGHRDD
jgi:protein-S-isoprenylcysteine O-methyltransferase Ste14